MTIDFIGIGSFKCGTTWITQCLKEHPEICVPSIKEVNFFNKMYDDGKLLYWNYDKGIGWYEAQFNECKSSIIKGEFSNYYLYDMGVPKLIKKHFPNVKLILSLRDPVDRAYSHFLWDQKNFNKNQGVSFTDHISTTSRYIEMSLYAKYLKRYMKVFGRENIHFVTLDQIKASPEKTVEKLYKYLGADPKFIPESLHQKVNPAVFTKYKILTRLFDLRNTLEKYKLSGVIDFLKHIHVYNLIQKAYVKINRKELTYEALNMEQKRAIFKKYFKEDVDALEKLTGLDLSIWKYETA